MPRKFAWAALPDDELLTLRFKDLKVKIEGTWLERQLKELEDELEERGIRILAHTWLGDEWFSPEDTPGFASHSILPLPSDPCRYCGRVALSPRLQRNPG
jgi:hypothetical protein